MITSILEQVQNQRPWLKNIPLFTLEASVYLKNNYVKKDFATFIFIKTNNAALHV